jgi:hypothetical protein
LPSYVKKKMAPVDCLKGKTMPVYETEYCGLTAAESEEGLGVAVMTLRLNGSPVPVAFELSRAQLERILEDGDHILENAVIMNTPETIEESSKRVAPEELPVPDERGLRVVHYEPSP